MEELDEEVRVVGRCALTVILDPGHDPTDEQDSEDGTDRRRSRSGEECRERMAPRIGPAALAPPGFYGASTTGTGVPSRRSSTTRSPIGAARVAVAVRLAPTAVHT
jgi:hypothetical protein